MEARDAQGAILESATYAYDDAGRLTRESFFDRKGQPLGYAEYRRTNGLLTSELRFDKTGKQLSRTEFQYKDKDLVAMRVYDAANQLELERTYAVQAGRITSGDETSGGATDKFIMKYSEADKRLEALVFIQQDGHPFGQIQYRYDAQKRIIERERIQVDKRELCRYEYDARGRVAKLTYYSMDTDWRLLKTLSLIYR